MNTRYIAPNAASSVYEAQALSLLTVRKIEVVKGMLLSLEYGHERSQAVLRRELRKLQAIRDKARKRVKDLIARECEELGPAIGAFAYVAKELAQG